MTTKQRYLEEYRRELIETYVWANDEARLDQFMERTQTTIFTKHALVTIEGPAAQRAWKTIGGEGRMTLTKLRNLP